MDSLLAEPPGKPKNTGVGSLSLLQRIFLIQESNQDLLRCTWTLLGKPTNTYTHSNKHTDTYTHSNIHIDTYTYSNIHTDMDIHGNIYIDTDIRTE